MTTDLTRQAHLPAVTDEGFLEEVRTQIAPKATDSELRYFAQVVAKTQLDPWSRQVYLIPRWDGRVKREVHRPQVSIDGLRLVAERTGKYEGQTPAEWCGDDGVWKDVWLSSAYPRASRVGVYKTGRAHPTYAVAHWDEYVVLNKQGKPSGLWPTKGAVMISKCAEALALRKTFPQETSGLYTAEEMGQADAGKTREPPALIPDASWEDAATRDAIEVATDAPSRHAKPAEKPVEDITEAVQGDKPEKVGTSLLDYLRETFLASGKTTDDLAWMLLSVGVESLPESPSKDDIGAAMRGLTVEQAKRLDGLFKDDAVPGSGEAA
jgi:phage recombination protein Bet